MIDIKQLSPKLLAGAALVTFSLGLGTAAATSYFTSKNQVKNSPCRHASRGSDQVYGSHSFGTTLMRISGGAAQVCPVVRTIRMNDGGYLTPAAAEDLVDCLENEGFFTTAEKTAQLMARTFPNSAVFPTRIGSYELMRGDRVGAERSLTQALRLESAYGLDRENGALLHNNYAWVLLSHKDINFPAVEAHSRRALELVPNQCELIHTRLTYEFAKEANKPGDLRNLSNWIAIRKPFVECLIAFQSPQYRSLDNLYSNESIATQVFSTYVMDSILLQKLDVDRQTAATLAPTRKYIKELGVTGFCEEAMGVSDPFVLAACERTARQASSYWNQWFDEN